MFTIFTMDSWIKSLTDIRIVKIHRSRPFKIGTFSGTNTLLGAPCGLFKACSVGVIVPIRDEETEAHRD